MSSPRHIRRKRRVIKLWYEQDGLCQYCDIPMHLTNPPDMNKVSGRLATEDHKYPKSKGGQVYYNGKPNIVLACNTCNLRKGSKTVERFLTEDWEWLTRKRANAWTLKEREYVCEAA